MVCSSCGYDNPRDHRYCGMCGTPFPCPITAPGAQDTLTFASAPLEVASSPLLVHPVEPALPVAEAVEAETITSVEPVEHVIGADTVQGIAPASIVQAEIVVGPLEPAVAEELSVAEVGSEVASTVPAEQQPVVEVPEPLVLPSTEEPVSISQEPVREAPPAAEPIIAEAAVSEPVAEPVPLAEGVEPPPVAAEPAPPVPDPPREEAPAAHEVPAPTVPRMVPRPVALPLQAPTTRAEAPSSGPVPIHPSPDSLPITLPPESAGMPTFQSVANAAGAPPISPFEPPARKDIDEDEELKEFIANFFYRPPDETVDELTMRSEVPEIDEEAPAQFHHPSFDDDVPPPPEAHTIDDAYLTPHADGKDRPRFLDIAERPQPTASDQPAPAASSPSFLHLDDAAPGSAPLDEVPPPQSRNWLMWSSVAALLLIFGGLGFLEGRAEMTHDFRGPIEIAREQYRKLRQRISQMAVSTTPPANAIQPDKQVPAQSEPSPTNQSSASSNPQPDSTSQQAGAAAPTTTPAPAEPQAQNQLSQPAGGQQSPVVTGTSPATSSTEVASAEPLKPLDAPPLKVSTKPQPGEAELTKALDASDSAAAAAWLWKSTSRGNPEAPVRLADMYIKGKGVPRSCEQALVLLRSAAVKANAPARNRLAVLYANGTCVARDRVRAYEFLSSALEVDPTSEWADQSRKELWGQMTPAERAEAQKFH